MAKKPLVNWCISNADKKERLSGAPNLCPNLCPMGPCDLRPWEPWESGRSRWRQSKQWLRWDQSLSSSRARQAVIVSNVAIQWLCSTMQCHTEYAIWKARVPHGHPITTTMNQVNANTTWFTTEITSASPQKAHELSSKRGDFHQLHLGPRDQSGPHHKRWQFAVFGEDLGRIPRISRIHSAQLKCVFHVFNVSKYPLGDNWGPLPACPARPSPPQSPRQFAR